MAPCWAATVHSPSPYARVTVSDGDGFGFAAREAAFREVRRWDELLSTYKDTSEITILNKAAGVREVRLSSPAFQAVQTALEFAKTTGGAFDPTYASDPAGPGHPDYRQIYIDPARNAVFLPAKGMRVNLGGIGHHAGFLHRAHVHAAKAGLEGLTRGLAIEYADKGITVNCVAPGRIGGPRSKTAGSSAPNAKTPPTGYEGAPEDIAAAIRYVCSPDARFVTGQVLHINGGQFMN